MTPRLYAVPELDLEDVSVLTEIHGMRADLAAVLRTPRRWQGGLRRTMLARAIRGSNSIEGVIVDADDAAAAVDEQDPMTADEQTWAEIKGYRQALTFVMHMAGDAHFVIDASTLRSMHFMLLGHDLSKSPGQYRHGPIFVRGDASDVVVYEGPAADDVPALVTAFADALGANADIDVLVRAAMAHLNLVMIHPFRDGNGRMSRAVQTLVLARDRVVEPAFSSIEEWLGRNTDDYYSVLAVTGGGSWQPQRSAHDWVKFNLRSHHMQAQTLAARVREAEEIWRRIDEVLLGTQLPERAGLALYDAVLGYRVRRPAYVKHAAIEERTASRDLARLVDMGLLKPVGETRARHYEAADRLVQLRGEVRAGRSALEDPFPGLMPRLRAAAK